MFKRPDHLPLGILNGHNSLVAGYYKHSLGEYVAALKQSPDDPLLNLLIAVTFIHMASQKFATKRHSLVVQVRACVHFCLDKISFWRDYNSCRIGVVDVVVDVDVVVVGRHCHTMYYNYNQ